MVNAWKLHVICAKYCNRLPLTQLEFRIQVVESLVTIPETKLPKGKAIENSQRAAARADRVDHLVEKMDKRSRCVQCGTKTEFGCRKCAQTLHPKCFADFHNNVKKDENKIRKAQ